MIQAMPPFGKFLGVMSGLSLRTLLSNFNSVALTVFELLAFNAQKIRGSPGSRDPATPPLENFLGVMSGLSLGTSVSNFKPVALTVFELLAFNSHWPAAAHTQTDKQTHIDRTHFLCHSLRSLGRDKYNVIVLVQSTAIVSDRQITQTMTSQH